MMLQMVIRSDRLRQLTQNSMYAVGALKSWKIEIYYRNKATLLTDYVGASICQFFSYVFLFNEREKISL